MDHGTNVSELAAELARAVEVTLSPAASQQQRMEAYVACEKFKEVSPLCPQAGFFLANNPQFSSVVKHFGLQLVEHTIKFNWNNISQQEKVFIKESSMKLLHEGVGLAQDQSVAHIKDALSRIIVEMIKREWPQQWTTLLVELSEACTKGEAQTELVLLIFLRLVEDVALLHTIESNQRRKDIYQALTNNMGEIFDFFLRLIEQHVNEFRKYSSMQDPQKAMANSRVVQVALHTLGGFVDWVTIKHIMAGNGRLLQILCILLSDVDFQAPAAECLIQIASRKGNIKDRKELLVLFSEDALSYIYRSAVQTNQMGSEAYYQFLKKLAQVLTGLCSQLTAMWGKEETKDDIRPTNFRLFLETSLILLKHASYTLTHYGALIWLSMMKHDQISKDPTFVEYIPQVINLVGPKIIKVFYPATRPTEISMHPQVFASIDYDSEEEYFSFFARCRSDLLDIFRQSTLITPLVTFGYCEQWLTLRLQKAPAEQTTCSIRDPAYLEWDAIVMTLESVLSRILMVTERPSVATGLRLLESCLKIDSPDPLIVSILLSCISSLFVFLSMSSCQITANNCVAMSGVALLPKVLEKIFSTFMFPDPGHAKSNQSTAVKQLRRHAASLMVKIALKYPLLLLPIFDQIHASVQALARQTDLLTSGELIQLQEALLLISNHFCDYERQSTFVLDVIRPAATQWMTLSAVLKSPQAFIEFVGLNQQPINPPTEDGFSANRGQIINAITLTLGILKRCAWPEDPDRAQRGGFVVAYTESGNPIFRNPATAHIVPLLPHILALLRVLNELYKPEALMAISAGYKQANSLPDTEKKVLMGITAVLTDPMDPNLKPPSTAEERMQKFLHNVYENMYHLIGATGPTLGRDLYAIPGLSTVLIESIFTSLEYVPDYRLRPIVRVFFKAFVYSCPPACYESVLLPIFAHLTPFMLNRLTTRWQYIMRLYESGDLGEDITDTQEVIEDLLNRSMTKEYLETLKTGLVGGTLNINNQNQEANAASGMETGMDVQEEHSMDGAAPALSRATQSAMTSDVINDLGSQLLRSPYTSSPIVMTILSILSWNDSMCSLKATQLTAPVVRFLSAEQLLTPALASNIIAAILQALQLHGQHDCNQAALITLGVQTYEILRPKFPNIMDVMQQIPNISTSDIQKLDEKISVHATTKGNKIDKAKKDLFRKITSQLIGRNLGQLFKKEAKIADLPALNVSTTRNRATMLIFFQNYYLEI
ncbi:exportin-5 isoform X3 [Culicoides brevitarsis]|uniref:exportin-5 isoform X3 n=1 Tax=Culicoides brevitarsis TaxID=469753 RepID=UPI00307C5B00